MFLDIAKQNTDNGLAFTLFSNFLKKLGLRDDVYGYMEYDFLIEGKLDVVRDKAKELFKKDWDELKRSNKEIAKAMRRIYMALDYSEAEYEDTKKVYTDSILNFDSDQFKTELEKYIKSVTNEFLEKK